MPNSLLISATTGSTRKLFIRRTTAAALLLLLCGCGEGQLQSPSPEATSVANSFALNARGASEWENAKRVIAPASATNPLVAPGGAKYGAISREGLVHHAAKAMAEVDREQCGHISAQQLDPKATPGDRSVRAKLLSLFKDKIAPRPAAVRETYAGDPVFVRRMTYALLAVHNTENAFGWDTSIGKFYVGLMTPLYKSRGYNQSFTGAYYGATCALVHKAAWNHLITPGRGPVGLDALWPIFEQFNGGKNRRDYADRAMRYAKFLEQRSDEIFSHPL